MSCHLAGSDLSVQLVSVWNASHKRNTAVVAPGFSGHDFFLSFCELDQKLCCTFVSLRRIGTCSVSFS